MNFHQTDVTLGKQDDCMINDERLKFYQGNIGHIILKKIKKESLHTPLQNHSATFRWLVEVVWVPLQISFWGVTPFYSSYFELIV